MNSGHEGALWARWSGVAAGLAGVAGVITLGLFYVLQVPHLHQGTGSMWRFSAAASLGDSNDLIGILFELLLIPFVVGLWLRLPGRATAGGRAVLALGGGAAGIAALAGILMVTDMVPQAVASAISGVASVLIGAWVGLVSRQARGTGVLSPFLTRAGQAIGLSIGVSALLVGAGLALPRAGAAVAAIVVVAVPGILGYIAMPVWVTWSAATLGRSRGAG